MFLKPHKKRVGGEEYTYWSLVRSVRTARGSRHEHVADLGKLSEGEVRGARGWAEIEDMLDGVRTRGEQMLLEGVGVEEEKPLWRTVDVRGIRVERVRQFGRVYVGLALWRRLGLHKMLREQIGRGGEDVGWDMMACVLTMARFSGQTSELSVAERWYRDTALGDLLGVGEEKVNGSRLYRCLDELLVQKEAITEHLLKRYRDWFGTRFEFLLYDVTSTYFEGVASRNEMARHGYSRDGRSDCKQVCIGLVVTPEGLPMAYEVFEGNRSDVTTMKEIVEQMEEKYGQAERIWVFDRGIVSEENLEWLRARGGRYLVGTPKNRLREFEKELLEGTEWQEIYSEVEVKLVRTPDGENAERYVICRSGSRAEKERAMLERQIERLREELDKIDRQLQKEPEKEAGPIERRIGKWLGRATAAEKVFDVKLKRDAEQRICGLEITERKERLEWARRAHGVYLLRTNYVEGDATELWKWYIQLSSQKRRFVLRKVTWLCGRCFIRRQRESGRIFLCVSLRWHCGVCWSSGWRARVWAHAHGDFLRKWMNCR